METHWRSGRSIAEMDDVQPERPITIVLADDNLLVREGVRALLAVSPGIEVAGVAADRDELIAAAAELQPQVVVTDIRMPPTFTDEGIEAAKQVRKMNPGTGIVILSQYDDPGYAISLLGSGASGYAYLLKDRVADGDRLARAVREVATGGSMLDPEIVTALVSPVEDDGELSPAEVGLLRHIAEGRPVKAIAVAERTTPEAVNDAVERLFLTLARGASAGRTDALHHLRTLQRAIVDREEQGATLSRMLPGGLAEKLRSDPTALQRPEQLDVTVLMSDVRGYSSIAERTEPTVLAGQLNEHRRAMNAAVLEHEGTVMQYVGDAVMAVFGAPFEQSDHAARALRAAVAMHTAQEELNEVWRTRGLDEFGLGIGVSTGTVAAAALGSEERLEYTVVGDTVNLAQRLQDLARPAGTTVVSDATVRAAGDSTSGLTFAGLGEQLVKGRDTPVVAHRLVRPAAALTAAASTGEPHR
jgi:class 3 adenylate cyclase/ActR/RegA family two-component response regulator